MKYLLLAFILILSGCTPRLSVNIVKSPTFNTKNKTVSVSSFKNDYLNLSSKIENELYSLKLKRGNSDYIIDGVIFDPTVSSYRYIGHENRLVTIPVIVNGYRSYETVTKLVEVSCLVKTYTVNSIINIIDNNKNIVFSKKIDKSRNIDFCQERSHYRGYENYDIDYGSIGNEIASEFSKELLEQNYFKNILIIDELENNVLTTDIKTKELLFKSAIDKLRESNFSEAIRKFEQVNDNAATYNLGLIEESKENYNKALEFYLKAGNSNLVNEAINRVKETILSIDERNK